MLNMQKMASIANSLSISQIATLEVLLVPISPRKEVTLWVVSFRLLYKTDKVVRKKCPNDNRTIDI